VRRVVGFLLALPFVLVAVVLTWPALFRLERTFPVAQLIAFRGPLLLALGAVLVVALLLALARPLRVFAFTLALAMVVTGGAVALTLLGRGAGSEALGEKTATSVRVMTWNTAGSATSADTIAKMAVAMQADIVTLPETTIDTGEQVAIAMRELGSPMWAHHAAYGDYGIDGWDADSTTLLISPALGDYSVIESSQDGTSNTSTVPSAVAMPVDGDGPIVVAAHAVAPREEYMDSWRSDLQWLADQCVAGSVILAGDFNATLDHMSGLGVDGATLGHCDDAAAETGNGARGTWPARVPPLVGAPIDHVMVSSAWRATGSAVLTSLDDSGSDHRPLIVQLEPAG
jgi:endonuclease/exonuclease/phosphatase (EEP) superfamily protein YafD